MFTGIVEEVGEIAAVKRGPHSSALTISGTLIFSDLKLGDSVAVNGVCLTVTGIHGGQFTADVMHETLDRSSLENIRPGTKVNLERAMAADGRFGGHIVAGHVDGLGRISQVAKDDNAIWYTIKAAPDILRYIVEKGSVAIDGISLTVARVSEDSFAISAIPHTVRVTTLCQKGPGDPVNLETDIIGKYVEKLMAPVQPQPNSSKITRDFLEKYGF